MNYNDPAHALEASLGTIIRGAEDFIEVAIAREDSGDFNREHVAELQEFSDELTKLIRKAKVLRKENW